MSDGTCVKTGNTVGLLEVWEGNPTCKDMGFDFGWKSPDPGCVDHEQEFSGGYLSLTKLATACDNCDTNNVGTYDLECYGQDGNQFKYANITSATDVYVFVKGGSLGGSLYLLEAQETHHKMRTPTGQAISHIEFCFLCETPATASPVSTAPIVTMSPTSLNVTLTPTQAPNGTTSPTSLPGSVLPSATPPVTSAPIPTGPPISAPPTTDAPTRCDACEDAPDITDIPESKTVCPGDFMEAEPYDVKATDVCGNDLFYSIVATQTLDFPENNTCAGTVTNRWSVQPPGCNSTEPAIATQTIVVEDIELPAFADAVLPDVVFSCPADYNVSNLVKPFASDNCDADVDVFPQTGWLEGCEDLDVLWVAMDDCGNEATLSQTVKFDDYSPPLLKSSAPNDVILTCSSALPPPTTLTFADNCDGEIVVNSTDEDTGGSYCDGKITTRTWEGPVDTCGNGAADVVQEIKVLDQAPPVLPDDLPVINLTCPSVFDVSELIAPNATDDCSSADGITVEGSAPEPFACNNVIVSWTATDECGNAFTSYQGV